MSFNKISLLFIYLFIYIYNKKNTPMFWPLQGAEGGFLRKLGEVIIKNTQRDLVVRNSDIFFFCFSLLCSIFLGIGLLIAVKIKGSHVY